MGTNEIEYKAVTKTGFETSWTGGGEFCGTRGLAVPLVGFAIRGKPGTAADRYNLMYRGQFRSGMIAGPFSNGAACLSSVVGDALEAIELRIVERPASAAPASDLPMLPVKTGTPIEPGPRFSPLREAAAVAASDPGE